MRRTCYILMVFLLLPGCARTPHKSGLPEPPLGPVKAAPIGISPFEEELKAQIDQLLRKLASDEYEDREASAAELETLLMDIPESIDALVRRHEEAKDLEVKHRLELILAPYTKWRLTTAILKEFPNIREILESAGPKARKELIAELVNTRPDGWVRLLVVLLRDKHHEVSWGATVALTKIDKTAIEPLIEALKNGDNDVRRYVTYILGRIGAKRALEPLFEILEKDDDPEVRCTAAEALGNIGDSGAIGQLVKALKDEHSEVRRRASVALKRIGPLGVAPLINALKDDREDVRCYAAEAFYEIKDERALPQLMVALNDKTPNVRKCAAWALGFIGDETAALPLIDALSDDDCCVRGAAARALGMIRIKEALGPLIEALGDEDADVRKHVVEALVQIGDQSVVGPLRKLWGREKDDLVQLAAAYGLAKIASSEKAYDFLLRSLKHEVFYIRCRSAEALGKIGDKKGIEPLIQALGDSDDFVRADAAEALIEIGDERAVEPLRKLWGCDEDKHVQLIAAYGLAKIASDENAYGLLVKSLKGKTSYIRRQSVEALGKIGSNKATEPLIETLGDGDYVVRAAAANALLEIRDKMAIIPLIEALNDREPLVRQSAAKALKSITSQDFDEDHSKWQQWWEKNKSE